jgi:hypothetical protein
MHLCADPASDRLTRRADRGGVAVQPCYRRKNLLEAKLGMLWAHVGVVAPATTPSRAKLTVVEQCVAPAENRTRVWPVAGAYSTTRPRVLATS